MFAGILKCQCRPCECSRGHDYGSRGRKGANKGRESAHRGRRCTQRGCESTALQAKRVIIDCRGFHSACIGREIVNRGP